MKITSKSGLVGARSEPFFVRRGVSINERVKIGQTGPVRSHISPARVVNVIIINSNELFWQNQMVGSNGSAAAGGRPLSVHPLRRASALVPRSPMADSHVLTARAIFERLSYYSPSRLGGRASHSQSTINEKYNTYAAQSKAKGLLHCIGALHSRGRCSFAA